MEHASVPISSIKHAVIEKERSKLVRFDFNSPHSFFLCMHEGIASIITQTKSLIGNQDLLNQHKEQNRTERAVARETLSYKPSEPAGPHIVRNRDLVRRTHLSSEIDINALASGLGTNAATCDF